jgi:hypothetical protein
VVTVNPKLACWIHSGKCGSTLYDVCDLIQGIWGWSKLSLLYVSVCGVCVRPGAAWSMMAAAAGRRCAPEGLLLNLAAQVDIEGNRRKQFVIFWFQALKQQAR